MREDYKIDWVEASLVKDLNYLKTGVKQFEEQKEYFSTGSIKDDSINSEGSYTHSDRPSRANRVGQIGDILQARMKNTDKAVMINNNLNNQLFSTGFFQIRTDPKSLLPKYLFHYFKSFLFLNQKDSNCSGSTQSALNDKSAQNIFVPIAPMPIQRVIVAKIEEFFSDLDKGISDLKKAQDQLKVYRLSVLKKGFEGELTKQWRERQTDLPTADELLDQIKEERQKHHDQKLENWKQEVKTWQKNEKKAEKPRKPSSLNFLPLLNEEEIKKEIPLAQSWIYIKIGNLCKTIVPNRYKPKSFSGDISWITTPDLNKKSIHINYSLINKGLTKEEINQYNAKIIPIGSVIMTCVGKLGISSIVERPIVINQQLHAFLPSSNYVSKYLAYYIRFNKSYFNRASAATTVQYLNKTKCNSLPIPICTVKEQHQIVQKIESRLSVCDKVEQSISESLEKSKALRQSILKKAFEGTLLSEEDIAACKAAPDYEPASVLLEKIKAEKKNK